MSLLLQCQGKTEHLEGVDYLIVALNGAHWQDTNRKTPASESISENNPYFQLSFQLLLNVCLQMSRLHSSKQPDTTHRTNKSQQRVLQPTQLIFLWVLDIFKVVFF